MLTYAVDDKSSFRNVQMWANEFSYYADLKDNTQFPFIVIGNKVSVHIFIIFLPPISKEPLIQANYKSF